MSCPLCKSSLVKVEDTVSVAEISKDYLSKYGLKIASTFKDLETLNYVSCEACDLRYYDPLAVGDQAFYEGLQKFDWYYPEEKHEFAFAADFIKASDRVLEVGSGKGSFAKKILAQDYIGLEFSHNAIALAKANGITVINEAVNDHAKKHAGHYDVVCTFQVLEHVSDIHEFLRACTACLKPGGRLIVSVPSLDSFSQLVANFELDMPPHHVSRWSDKALRSIGQLFSLDVKEIWHEPLQEVHRMFYTYAVIQNALRRWLGRSLRVVETSFFGKLCLKVSWHLARALVSVLTDPALHLRGISVTAVFIKQ